MGTDEILFGNFKSLTSELKSRDTDADGSAPELSTSFDHAMDGSTIQASSAVVQHERQPVIIDTILNQLIFSTKTAVRSPILPFW